jgi:hypothetical protein
VIIYRDRISTPISVELCLHGWDRRIVTWEFLCGNIPWTIFLSHNHWTHLRPQWTQHSSRLPAVSSAAAGVTQPLQWIAPGKKHISLPPHGPVNTLPVISPASCHNVRTSGPRPQAPHGGQARSIDALTASGREGGRKGCGACQQGGGYKDIRGVWVSIELEDPFLSMARWANHCSCPALSTRAYVSHSCVLWIALCVLFDRFWEEAWLRMTRDYRLPS